MKRTCKVKQRDITDCGAACLASMAAHYKLRIPVSKIRQHAGTDKRGTNIAGIIEAGTQLGFEVKPAKGALESLAAIPLPAIAHVIVNNHLHHFVVLYKVNKKHVLYMDPADGRMHRKSPEVFKEFWTGTLILAVPAATFEKGDETRSKLARFVQLLQPHKGVVFQSLLGAMVYTALGLAMSIYVQKIVDFVLVEGNTKLLNLLSLLMMAILLFQLFIGYVKSIIALQCGQYIDAALILGYYKHLLRLPQRFFDTMRVGEIISRVNDAVKIRLFVNDVAVSMFVNACTIVLVVAIMFVYYWKLAVISLLLIPLQAVIYWISNKINKRIQRSLMENAAELETQLVESITAAGTIKRFGLEEYASFKTETKFIRLLKTVYVAGKRGLQLNSASDFFTKALTVAVLWAGSYFVINREISPGELLSFYSLLGFLTSPVAGVIAANKSIQDALIAMDRLYEIVDLETEVSAEQQVVLSKEAIGDIHFMNVHFRYGTRAPVFKGLNLVLTKGQMNAIVGESGSGKSTLLSLMQNIYPLKEGNILIGDIDLKYYTTQSLRQLISVVPQHIDLFAGTIVENVAIGETEPDVKRVIQLCYALGLHAFIEQLPGGYNTYLSEQGVNLSGGQRQRIAIARALYRQPEILILDEATASLDPVSEQYVQHVLQQYKQAGKTIIVIAHRLSTIRHAECINVLHEGKLIESGTHEELMTKQSHYYQLWQQYAIG